MANSYATLKDRRKLARCLRAAIIARAPTRVESRPASGDPWIGSSKGLTRGNRVLRPLRSDPLPESPLPACAGTGFAGTSGYSMSAEHALCRIAQLDQRSALADHVRTRRKRTCGPQRGGPSLTDTVEKVSEKEL